MRLIGNALGSRTFALLLFFAVYVGLVVIAFGPRALTTPPHEPLVASGYGTFAAAEQTR